MVEINATQLAGILSFAMPAIFCALAGRRLTGIWYVLAALYTLLAVEVIFGNRHLISETLSAWSADTWVHNNRRGIVAVLIIGTISLFAIKGIISIAKLNKALIYKISLMTATSIIAVFILEIASLHHVSALLYTSSGPVLLIGWIWLALGTIAALAATLACLESRKKI